MKKFSLYVFYIVNTLVICYSLIYLYGMYNSIWWELSWSERSAIKEYRVEVGLDVAYCMRVPASEETYLSILKKKKFVKYEKAKNGFARECNEVKWWDINENTLPEFYINYQNDMSDVIARINGVIYYSHEIW